MREDHREEADPPANLDRRGEAADSERPRQEAELARIVGQSPAIREIKRQIRLHAPLQTSVLMLGDTGTGKGLAADVLHALSGRAGECVHRNCATIKPSLADSNLFGHEPGAFTDARGRRVGAIERADGGTLFLDELTELPGEVQAKLLTVLDDGYYERVGGSETRRSDFRLVAATAAKIDEALERGKLRADLYFRIRTSVIHLPPLADRGYDVVLLARALLDDVAAEIRLDRSTPELTRSAETLLLGRSWPGNIRGLKYVLATALIRAEDGVIDEAAMGEALDANLDMSSEPSDWLPTLAEAEEIARRETIQRALAVTEGNLTKAARLLGISPSTLYRHRLKLGLLQPEEDGHGD